MNTINIIDKGCERYSLDTECLCLGRRWDNISEQIKVVKPVGEENNVCAMIVLYDGEVIDHIIVGDEPIDITSHHSQYPNIEIGFSFSNETGYIKNSESRNFYFADSIKPTDFVPLPPTQEENLNNVIGKSFVRSAIVEQTLNFYNVAGQIVSSVDLSGFAGGSTGGVVEETDPTVPAWAKQPNKPTYTYNEIQNKPTLFSGNYNDLSNKPSLFSGDYNDLRNKPTIPSVNGLASENYVDNKANTTLAESKSYTDKKVSDLVGSAPSTLDTLAEISSALQNNPNVVKALNDAIGTKQSATDNSLQTTSKNIVGAINEINSKFGNTIAQIDDILGV